ncbi:unnamed protein product, partial [marine sediment metagenome]
NIGGNLNIILYLLIRIIMKYKTTKLGGFR